MVLSDEKFQARLKVGKEWEQVVADSLVDQGIPATTNTPIDEADYAGTDTDIMVGDKTIEVKSRTGTCPFTGPEDFPFKDVFVETSGGWEAKQKKPDYYVIVSQITGGMIVIPGDTRDQWNCRSIYDKACGFKTKTLVADKSLMKPVSWMVDELKGVN